MTVYVIDGQGGGVGKTVVERLKAALPRQRAIAIGSNAAATSAMLKGGADSGATGENAVLYCCRKAMPDDVIVGPLGILLANAMLGEISPAMAQAVAESEAHKVLIPVSRCHASVAGVAEQPLAQYIEDAIRMIRALPGTPV